MAIALRRISSNEKSWRVLMSNKNRSTDVRLTWIDRIFLTPLLLYLPVMVFEGVLRYYLWHKDLVELVYIPKALMFGLFWLALIVDLARRRLNKTFLILVGIRWRPSNSFYGLKSNSL